MIRPPMPRLRRDDAAQRRQSSDAVRDPRQDRSDRPTRPDCAQCESIRQRVITGAHRSDIQLAALETSTRCIILTGGLTTNDVVIGKAQSKGVPIISVADDTFTTVDKIGGSMGKANIREKRKVARVRELMDMEFDMKRFLKTMK